MFPELSNFDSPPAQPGIYLKEIKESALTHLFGHALRCYQPEGNIRLPGGGISGFSLSNEHWGKDIIPMAGPPRGCRTIMALHFAICKH